MMEDATSVGIDALEARGAAGQRSAGGVRTVEMLGERPRRLGVGLVAQALELGGALAALPDAAVERERRIERQLGHPVERGAPVALEAVEADAVRLEPAVGGEHQSHATRRLPRWRASRASRCPPRACGRSPRRARARPRRGCRPRARAGAPPPAVPRRGARARSRAHHAGPWEFWAGRLAHGGSGAEGADSPGELAATSRFTIGGEVMPPRTRAATSPGLRNRSAALHARPRADGRGRRPARSAR